MTLTIEQLDALSGKRLEGSNTIEIVWDSEKITPDDLVVAKIWARKRSKNSHAEIYETGGRERLFIYYQMQ